MTITKIETDVDIGLDNECPICAENPPFNATVKAAIAEGDAIFFGENPAKWYSSFEEGRKDLGI